ncbi:RHS repeat domain-containing protein [Streptomyces alboflavus]|uniref:RHS repeat domain-containing protein n=1 Tax=Streptomyces alboflavus TaxID=67267 RepID=UPI0036A91E91
MQFLAGDHHGTSLAAVDAQSGAVTRRRMDPFGNARDAGVTDPWVDDKGFLGKPVDASTGLTHIGAREYEPENGRFISVDPLIDFQDPQQINTSAIGAKVGRSARRTASHPGAGRRRLAGRRWWRRPLPGAGRAPEGQGARGRAVTPYVRSVGRGGLGIVADLSWRMVRQMAVRRGYFRRFCLNSSSL